MINSRRSGFVSDRVQRARLQEDGETCWHSSRTVTSLSQSDMQNLGALNQPDHYGSSDEFTGLAWFFYRYLTLVLPGIFPPQGLANILRFFNKTLTFYKTLVFFLFSYEPTEVRRTLQVDQRAVSM